MMFNNSRSLLKKMLLLGMLFSIVGCQASSQSLFPLDSDQYPLAGVVMINEEKKEFKIQDGDKETIQYSLNKEDKEIKVIVAQGVSIHTGIVDKEIAGLELVSQDKYLARERTSNEKEGVSLELQEFVYKIKNVNEVSTLSLKKIDVDEKDKENPKIKFELSIKFDKSSE